MNDEASSSELPSIESLMMTYVDLSLNNSNGRDRGKKASFKGPPLKDLKVCKKKLTDNQSTQPLPYHHSTSSQKSIDWKAFDGSSLQNTFVIESSSSKNSTSNEDEWGDFTSCEPTVVSIVQSDTKEKEEEEDDFSDFISLRASSSHPTHQQPSTLTQPLNKNNLIEISNSNESQNSNSRESDKYSALRDIMSLNDSTKPCSLENELGNSTFDYLTNTNVSEQSSSHQPRSSATDFFGLSPEPMSQPVCQSPIPLSTGGNSDSSFNILHLDQFSGSTPPEVAPTSDILGPSPLPDASLDNVSLSKNLDSIQSDISSSSSSYPPFSKASVDDVISLSSNGSSSAATSQPPTNLLNSFVQTPSEDRYQAFREVIPSFKEEENPLGKWLKLLSTCYELLFAGANTFSSIEDALILKDVLSSKKTNDYIVNLIEVYRVSRRIQTSFRFVEEMDVTVELYGQIKEQFNVIDKAWCTLLEKVKCKETDNIFYSFLDQGKVSCKRSDYSHCGICCSFINDYSGEATKWNDAFCKYGSRQYHSSCANLWINCVERTLPDL